MLETNIEKKLGGTQVIANSDKQKSKVPPKIAKALEEEEQKELNLIACDAWSKAE